MYSVRLLLFPLDLFSNPILVSNTITKRGSDNSTMFDFTLISALKFQINNLKVVLKSDQYEGKSYAVH